MFVFSYDIICDWLCEEGCLSLRLIWLCDIPFKNFGCHNWKMPKAVTVRFTILRLDLLFAKRRDNL